MITTAEIRAAELSLAPWRGNADNRNAFDLAAFFAYVDALPADERRAAVTTEHAYIVNKLGMVKRQIEDAKAKALSGEWADPDWFARTGGARRFYGFVAQRLQERLGTMPKAARKHAGGRAMPEYFMDAAKRLLTAGQFEAILIAAAADKDRNDQGAGK